MFVHTSMTHILAKNLALYNYKNPALFHGT